jgi:hypothetical protein
LGLQSFISQITPSSRYPKTVRGWSERTSSKESGSGAGTRLVRTAYVFDVAPRRAADLLSAHGNEFQCLLVQSDIRVIGSVRDRLWSKNNLSKSAERLLHVPREGLLQIRNCASKQDRNLAKPVAHNHYPRRDGRFGPCSRLSYFHTGANPGNVTVVASKTKNLNAVRAFIFFNLFIKRRGRRIGDTDDPYRVGLWPRSWGAAVTRATVHDNAASRQCNESRALT